MKNVACSRLGAMLHLEIQKGKEAMKRSKFQKCILGTAVCMKILAIAAKECGQLTSNDTYFSDKWFGYVKTAEEVMDTGFDYYGPVKISHKVFFIAKLENLMKDWPEWSYIVMKSTQRVPYERPLLAIGYKYNSRTVLVLVAT